MFHYKVLQFGSFKLVHFFKISSFFAGLRKTWYVFLNPPKKDIILHRAETNLAHIVNFGIHFGWQPSPYPHCLLYPPNSLYLIFFFWFWPKFLIWLKVYIVRRPQVDEDYTLYWSRQRLHWEYVQCWKISFMKTSKAILKDRRHAHWCISGCLSLTSVI